MIRRLTLAALALAAALAAAAPALADCTYNGRVVAEGTRIGSLVCENGRWVKK
mgnify:CR=1 FL=1